MQATQALFTPQSNEIQRDETQRDKTQRDKTQRDKTQPQALSSEDMELVHRIAGQVHRRTSKQAPYEELVGWGLTGMLEAKQRYRPDSQASFATYAGYRVRGAMLDGIGRIAPLPRAGYRRALHKDSNRQYAVDLDSELIPDHRERSNPEALIEKKQLRERLREALAKLPESQQHVLRRHYWEDAQLQDAAAEIGKSKFWASRKHSQALSLLRKRMQPAMAA